MALLNLVVNAVLKLVHAALSSAAASSSSVFWDAHTSADPPLMYERVYVTLVEGVGNLLALVRKTSLTSQRNWFALDWLPEKSVGELMSFISSLSESSSLRLKLRFVRGSSSCSSSESCLSLCLW